MSMLGDEREMYGRVRLGGTIAFGLAPPLAGVLVGQYGLAAAFYGCAAMFLLGLLVSQKLVHSQKNAEETSGGGIPALLRSPRWLVFLALAFAGGIASTGVNFYLFPYMKELGASETTMGLALTIGVIAEIPVMIFGNLLVRRFKAYGLLVLAMVLTGVRMLLFATTGNYHLVLVIQVLNGLTFPAMWLAGVAYADELAPPGLSATAQGLFAAMVFGIGSAAGGFICGPLLESMGGRGLFLVLGMIVLVIVGISGGVQYRLDQKQV
jgi:PPP family 3-phenylpropionic acid transporter